MEGNIMFKLLGNTHVPHRKNTANMPAVTMPPPKEVLIHVSQHIGAPARVIVKAGDEVKLGQLIAEADGYVSAPVHASVSGKVLAVESYVVYSGQRVDAVRIESDGEMTPADTVVPPAVSDLDSFIEAVRASGSVGMGGAGFPTAVKLDAIKKGGIDTIVINGAECEPYITADTRTMLDECESIKEGIELFERFAPDVKTFVFGIESNKPECIKKLKELFADDGRVQVKALPSLYPQGAEKVLIHNTTKRIVPEGGLPADVGVTVLNVSTLAFIAKYVKTGMPLVEKTLTLDGSAVAEPKNVTVPVGTRFGDVIDFCGGLKTEIGKALYGGPMMGACAASLDEPVLKTTNAITVMSRADSLGVKESACIHCGRCVAACPHKLDPTKFARALNVDLKEDRMARLEESHVMLCMECGSCSFVCPARRPLVQNNRIAKAELRDFRAHQETLEK